MISFEEKIYRLEQKKKEYRQRLKKLPEKKQKIVEDFVWQEASQLTQFQPFHDKINAITTMTKGVFLYVCLWNTIFTWLYS